MTERKLWNGWNNKKTVRCFLVLVILLYAAVWLFEAAWYQSWLHVTVMQMQHQKGMGITIDVEPYRFAAFKQNGFGLGLTIITTVLLAVVIVHKESFKENWDVTLRRIPGYRGKYLLTKLAAVSFPGGLYLPYCVLQCLWRRNVYEGRVPKELRTGEAVEAWKLLHDKSFGEIALYFVLLIISTLFGSLILRRIKRDILGAVVAFCGVAMAGLLFFNMPVTYTWQHPAIVGGFIIGEILFLVRHVYRKL